jgi:hypothetical protein
MGVWVVFLPFGVSEKHINECIHYGHPFYYYICYTTIKLVGWPTFRRTTVPTIILN